MTTTTRHSSAGRLAARSILLASLMLLAAPGAADDDAVVRLSEPVEATDTHETFGARLPEAGPEIALAELLADADRYLGREVKVATQVAQVCQNKGCFFIAQDESVSARVSFKDYGFFVPSDIGGRTVTLAGELQRRDVSADQADHYNEDMKAESAVVEPGPQYEIVATAVRVPRR